MALIALTQKMTKWFKSEDLTQRLMTPIKAVSSENKHNLSILRVYFQNFACL